jgi:hypothetical protein
MSDTKKQIKCSSCGSVVSELYGSELYPQNQNNISTPLVYCSNDCKNGQSSTEYNSEYANFNKYTDGSVEKGKDKYGNEILTLDIVKALVSSTK